MYRLSRCRSSANVTPFTRLYHYATVSWTISFHTKTCTTSARDQCLSCMRSTQRNACRTSEGKILLSLQDYAPRRIPLHHPRTTKHLLPPPLENDPTRALANHVPAMRRARPSAASRPLAACSPAPSPAHESAPHSKRISQSVAGWTHNSSACRPGRAARRKAGGSEGGRRGGKRGRASLLTPSCSTSPHRHHSDLRLPAAVCLHIPWRGERRKRRRKRWWWWQSRCLIGKDGASSRGNVF